MARKSGFDLVVVGASAGGVEALLGLVRNLPADFPAAVCVVLHVPATAMSVLPRILDRGGALPARHATDDAPIERGVIYVAPPDHHLLVGDGRLRVARGPRENGHRPAIDPLFRTAAASYEDAVAGVVLSGTLDDGAAGLLAVKDGGGATYAQHPDDALYAAMPRNAISRAAPEFVLPVAGIAVSLAELAQLPTKAKPRRRPDDPLEQRSFGTREDQWDAPRSAYGCPSCGGALWEVGGTKDGEVDFRCRTGHAFTDTALLNAQSDGLETALWTALRALEERIALTRRVAARLRGDDRAGSATQFELQAEDAEAHAALLRDVLENLQLLDHVDPGDETGAEVAVD